MYKALCINYEQHIVHKGQNMQHFSLELSLALSYTQVCTIDKLYHGNKTIASHKHVSILLDN